METKSFQVKINFLQMKEFRRFQIVSFLDLEKRCRDTLLKHFSSIDQISLMYEDEEKDWVQFSSEAEWKQAVQFYNKERKYISIRVSCKYNSNVTSMVEQIPERIEEFVKEVQKSVPKKVGEIREDIPKQVENFRKKINEFTEQIPKKVETFTKDTIPKTIETVKKEINEFAEDVKSIVYPEIPKQEKIVEISKVESPKEIKKETKILPAVHRDVLCNGCKCCPIIGPRYHCISKKDYDLCVECFNKRDEFKMENAAFEVFLTAGQQKPSKTIIPEEEAEEKFHMQLGLLTQMGFDNKEKNIKLLRKYKGDIKQCIQNLI